MSRILITRGRYSVRDNTLNRYIVTFLCLSLVPKSEVFKCKFNTRSKQKTKKKDKIRIVDRLTVLVSSPSYSYVTYLHVKSQLSNLLQCSSSRCFLRYPFFKRLCLSDPINNLHSFSFIKSHRRSKDQVLQ